MSWWNLLHSPIIGVYYSVLYHMDLGLLHAVDQRCSNGFTNAPEQVQQRGHRLLYRRMMQGVSQGTYFFSSTHESICPKHERCEDFDLLELWQSCNALQKSRNLSWYLEDPTQYFSNMYNWLYKCIKRIAKVGSPFISIHCSCRF